MFARTLLPLLFCDLQICRFKSDVTRVCLPPSTEVIVLTAHNVPMQAVTLRGVGWFVVDPDPTWPQLFCPQAKIWKSKTPQNSWPLRFERTTHFVPKQHSSSTVFCTAKQTVSLWKEMENSNYLLRHHWSGPWNDGSHTRPEWLFCPANWLLQVTVLSLDLCFRFQAGNSRCAPNCRDLRLKHNVFHGCRNCPLGETEANISLMCQWVFWITHTTLTGRCGQNMGSASVSQICDVLLAQRFHLSWFQPAQGVS